MKRFKNILVAVDSRNTEHPALSWAETLADHNQAKLKIVDVVPEVAWPWKMATPDYEHVQELLTKEKAELLEQLAEPIRAKGIDVTTRVLHGQSSTGIIQEVVRDDHDVVIRSPKGKRSRRATYFGSTSMRLLRRCPCAVWTVQDSQPQFRRVLAAVDPTPRDEEHARLNSTIMELALGICEHEGATPLIVHVWNLFGEGIFQNRMNEEEFDAFCSSAENTIRQTFSEFLEPYGIPLDDERVCLYKGEPGVIIPQLVTEKDVDLIVMGTVGRRGVPGLVMGNTAEMTLQRIECGVLAVKPEGFVSPDCPPE